LSHNGDAECCSLDLCQAPSPDLALHPLQKPMTLTLNRRAWIQSAGATATWLSAASYLRAAGANERVRAAVIGVGNMGRAHVSSWTDLPNTELVYVCDIDPAHLADVVKGNSALKPVGDLRKVLDDKSIDVVSIATPDHWHAPAALLAMEAGKHVYVEKPCAHNLREARALVDGARKYKLCVQHGTQARSNEFIQSAVKLLQDGIIGDVLVSKAWDVQRRYGIGHAQPSGPPAGVDYDTWLGPAPEVPFQSNRFHVNWRWWYDFGTGDMGNDGVHDLDIARWGLGVTGLPSRVTSIGGKYFHDDDQQFPDTQTAIFEYPGDGQIGQPRQLVFEMRLWTAVSPFNTDNGCEFYGTKGTMLLSKAGKIQVIGEDKKPIPREKLPEPERSYDSLRDHMGNLVAGIREGKPLNADIEVGYHSSALCHLATISARLGRSLQYDAQKEQITGDDEANRLITREYRTAHWGTPKGLA
jgi:predicted dehydrogenase